MKKMSTVVTKKIIKEHCCSDIIRPHRRERCGPGGPNVTDGVVRFGPPFCVGVSLADRVHCKNGDEEQKLYVYNSKIGTIGSDAFR